MNVTYDLASLSTVQQAISGAGAVFDGAEVGRASRTFGTGAAQIVFRSRVPGASSNAYTVALVDPGGTNSSNVFLWTTSTSLRIVLRRNAGGILATAQEVADLVNAQENGKFYATAGGADPLVAAGAASLAGGIDPVVEQGTYRYAAASTAHGGLFVFGHDVAIDVIHVSGRFTLGGATALKLQVVSLSKNLAPIEAEAFTFHSASLDTTEPSFHVNPGLTLPPGAAIRVSIAAPGLARVHFQRCARPRQV